MPGSPAARIQDPTTHMLVPLQPGPGSPNVFIGKKPAWRAMVDKHNCPMMNGPGVTHGVGSVLVGSSTVYINKQQACRVGDQVVEVLGGSNPISMGDNTVLIGG